jgi:hypothetical protein
MARKKRVSFLAKTTVKKRVSFKTRAGKRVSFIGRAPAKRRKRITFTARS